MSPTKKPSKLSADERAFVDRIRSLNEEETAKLTFEELDRSSIVRRITRLSDLFDSCFLNSGLHFLDMRPAPSQKPREVMLLVSSRKDANYSFGPGDRHRPEDDELS